MAEARTPEIAAWCALLSVAPDAPDEVIKAAGKALLTRHHPDRATDDADRARREARSKAISEAVAELCDPRNAPRARATTRTGGGSGGFGQTGGGAGPTRPSSTTSNPGAPGYTPPPFGTHYRWSDFTADEMDDMVRTAYATAKAAGDAQRAAAAAHERADRPARASTWLALPAAALSFVLGMLRWFERQPAPAPRPEWWDTGLFLGATLALVVAAAVIGRLRGTRRTATLALHCALLVAAPAVLVPALVAAVAAYIPRRPREDGADWSGAVVVAGAWGVLSGFALVGAGNPVLLGVAPALVVSLVWPLAAVTLGRIPPAKRDGARTAASLGVLAAPIAFPALLVAAVVVWARSRRHGKTLETPRTPG